MQLRKILRPLVIACSLTAAATSQAACPFNVAGTGAIGNAASYDALRDGVLITRYAQGLRGATLVAGTGATPATVEANITANLVSLDINGDGLLDVQDAIVINRALFGLAPDKLGSGVTNVNYGTRNTASVMQAFVSGGCTVTFAAPTADQIDASRFLIQSSFGPSRNDIMSFMTLTPDAAVSGSDHKKRRSTWINNQFNVPRGEKHFQYLMARKVEYDALGQTFYSEMSREAFWKQALKNNDQLRQRLAFALSEVLVVSANGGSSDPFELASYLDLLADNGFGNFKDILTKMALSPAMGRYLSHLRNDGGSSNPNENFAREILQLFAVGLFMLDPDGTQTTTPSYDENTVKGFAKVFTGFTYDDPGTASSTTLGYAVTRPTVASGVHGSFIRPGTGSLIAPISAPMRHRYLRAGGAQMVPFIGRHNKLEKQLLKYTTYPGAVSSCSSAITFASGTAILPAIDTTGSGVTTGTRVNATQANATIASAIDNIFCHPNVGPFISKHLIRFFVTSTPSDAYVGRVTAAFNNNWPAIRGDMRATIRAMLTDVEAVINPTGAATVASMKVGKLKEPILRLSAILRAFEGTFVLLPAAISCTTALSRLNTASASPHYKRTRYSTTSIPSSRRPVRSQRPAR